MWMNSLLFLFLLLGATAAQLLNSPGHAPSRVLAPSDGLEETLKAMLAMITKTFKSKDSKAIANLFTDDFIYRGCDRDYDKNEFVTIISILPNETDFSATSKSTKNSSAEKIEISVVVSGLGPTVTEDQFIMLRSGKLSRGRETSCRKSNSHGPSIKGSSWDMVQKFTELIVASVRTKNATIIAKLFQDDSLFIGCKDSYDKAGITNMLSHLPRPDLFAFTIKSVKDVGESVLFKVTVHGFEDYEVEAEFNLLKKQQTLGNGLIKNCNQSSTNRM